MNGKPEPVTEAEHLRLRLEDSRRALYDQLDSSLPNAWAISDLVKAIENFVEAKINFEREKLR